MRLRLSGFMGVLAATLMFVGQASAAVPTTEAAAVAAFDALPPTMSLGGFTLSRSGVSVFEGVGADVSYFYQQPGGNAMSMAFIYDTGTSALTAALDFSDSEANSINQGFNITDAGYSTAYLNNPNGMEFPGGTFDTENRLVLDNAAFLMGANATGSSVVPPGTGPGDGPALPEPATATAAMSALFFLCSRVCGRPLRRA